MLVQTINPYTSEKLNEYTAENIVSIRKRIESLRSRQREWKKDIDLRINYLKNTVRRNLARLEHELSVSMTSEMGKPINQSVAEIRKCITMIDYMAENAPAFLEPETVGTEAMKSYVRFDPIGVVELIMPWNYPLWQVMRAAIPALIAGNAILLKHSSIVSGTSVLIHEIMESPAFVSVIASGPDALDAIDFVDGVSFTGSSSVGAMICERAGRAIKKSVLELGGSDPFIVLESADAEKTAKQATLGRLQNAGQSCIASKRFIVHEHIYDDFRSALEREFSSVIAGDPMDVKTFLGPLSSSQQTEIVKKQVGELRTIGTVHETGDVCGNLFPPVIAEVERPYSDEIFGPVAVLKKFSGDDEAVHIANETPFGLGCSIWGDPDEAERLAPSIEAGMVFINRIVASDPRVPFGGVKKSGFGRELSRYGLLEFTNIKTTWIEKAP